MVDHIIDLLYDPNPQIRNVCDASLTLIGEIDMEWEQKLLSQKFAWHNAEWIKVITQEHHDHATTDDGFHD